MKLYKYLNPERIDVLRNKSIRFSPPIAFNDPFEFKPVISRIVSDEYMKNYMEENLENTFKLELSKLLPAHILNSIASSELKEFAMSYFKSNTQFFIELMDKAKNQASFILSEKSNELIGVLSLTEKPDNLLMWSHYAESHRGYCIGFKSSHSFFNRKRSETDEFYHLRKVEYISHRPSKTLFDMSGMDIFLLKSDVWEYEQEWRMCAVLSDADTIINFSNPSVHLFNFPEDVIEEIILGVNADTSLTEDILRIISENTEFSHVKVRQAIVSDTEFALRFIDL